MPLKVLMLDDEPDYGDLFMDTFASPDVDVTTFVDPEAAIAAARRSPPDLIFLDFRLPQTTANHVAPRLPANVPIYILSGELNPDVTFPCAGVITKPFKKQEVLALMKSIAVRLGK